MPQAYNFKLQKIIDKKNFETRGKQYFTYRGTKIRVTSDFSKTMQAGRELSENFKILRKNITG